jgi:Mn-containing catalase
MTREIAHQKSFEKALYSIEPNFPPGKRPGVPEYTDKYYRLSRGDSEDDYRGSWNSGPQWEFIDDPEHQIAMDGGDGLATVKLDRKSRDLLQVTAARTASHTGIDPITGADLSASPGGGATTHVGAK